MTPSVPDMSPEDFASADILPVTYESELRRMLAAQPDGGGSLIERVLSRETPVEVTLPNEGTTLQLFFDANSAALIVRDLAAPEQRFWQWRRLRRLVLRDYLLRNLLKQKRGGHELSPIIRDALRYPRQDLGAAPDIPALNQLRERSDARLSISEHVTFDRNTVPSTDMLETDAILELRADIQAHLATLTPDQTAAMVQDGVFEKGTPPRLPVVFPKSEYEALAAIVNHANPPARASVSLVLPVEAELRVDLGPEHSEETAATQVTILFLDLKPGDVMEVIRENTLIGPAEAILEQNGLSLLSLVIRESRLD